MKAQICRSRLREMLAEHFGIDGSGVDPTHALMFESEFALATHEDLHNRPGWTVVATDIAGMPWGSRNVSLSHGTWAFHDACGTIQKVTLARPECRTCPTELGSRTHRAKAGQPQYLYVVRYQGLLKFGHGDAFRVRSHLRAGCSLVAVRKAPFERVVAAEKAIRQAHREQLIEPNRWRLPATFGAGSEVVEGNVVIHLHDFLSGKDVRDARSDFG